jgi:peptidase E
VSVKRRQVFAFSGVLQNGDGRRSNFDLTEHAVALACSRDRPRLCYVPTAVGDSQAAIDSHQTVFRERRPDVEFSVLRLFTQPSVPDVRAHLLKQDVILVEGGSVVNLMAVWRAHNLPAVMRECWEAGVVLSGASAGSLCWHIGGPTDSYRDTLDPFTDGLGLLPFSNGVHDDFPDQPRRAVYRSMIATGTLPPGYASEDGVGLHYVGTDLHQAVSIREGARAWWVDQDGGNSYIEHPIDAALL